MCLRDDEYRTVDGIAEGLYKEKGSRFLAFAYNVSTPDEAKAIVKEKQKEFHDARHHCFAWKIGPGENCFRMGDDGEPSGTAGKPIYGQIQSAGLTNILIVVVRYFGGIKLGTGGLIVAYKTASADALANANIVVRTYDAHLSISFPYIAMNDVMKILKDSTAKIVAQDFNNDCRIDIVVRMGERPMLETKFADVDSVVVEDLSVETADCDDDDSDE